MMSSTRPIQTNATTNPDANARNRIVFSTVEANPSALIPFTPDLEAVVAVVKPVGRLAVADVSAGLGATVAEGSAVLNAAVVVGEEFEATVAVTALLDSPFIQTDNSPEMAVATVLAVGILR